MVPVKVAIDRWYVEQASPGIDALVVVGLARRLAGRPVGALLERIRAGVPEAAGSLP